MLEWTGDIAFIGLRMFCVQSTSPQIFDRTPHHLSPPLLIVVEQFEGLSAAFFQICPPVFRADSKLRKGEIKHYSVRMRENTDQSNSEYGHFSRSVYFPSILPIFAEHFFSVTQF